MPNEDRQRLWCRPSQLIDNVYNPVREYPPCAGKKFTTTTVAPVIRQMATFVFNNSAEILRDAAEEIPWRTPVCEKDTFSCSQNKAAEVTNVESTLTRVAKLSETKLMVGWLSGKKVYVRICTQNQNSGKWSPSSLTHQIHGVQNLNVRHFDLIGMSENVAVMGLIPDGDSSRQYLLRISLQGDSIYEQGEATLISDQYANYIALCRLSNTKFMCALWGHVYFNGSENKLDPYHGQTFVHEMEMSPFIYGVSTQKQEFRQNRLAYYAGRGFLSATADTPDALAMTAVDENSVVIARLAGYNNFIITERIVPHASEMQALISDENLVHQTPLQGATKICSTVLISNLIISCVVAQDKVFIFVDKADTADRLLIEPILNFVPDKMAIKKLARDKFILLVTCADADSANVQLIKYQYNTLTNKVVELSKLTQLRLSGGDLEVFNHNYAVLCGNRRLNQNEAPRVTVQPCLISSGIAIARPGDEIIGISNTYPNAAAGDPVQILIPADRVNNYD